MDTTTTNGTKTTTKTTGTATSKTTGTQEPASTADKFSDVAHRAVDNVADRLADAERKLRGEAKDKEEAIKDVADKATDKASELQQKTTRYINENPMTAAGIAFAAGILFSAWMRK